MRHLKPLALAILIAVSGGTLSADDTALAGDAEAGSKVFRKCKACHSLLEGKNGAGPSLWLCYTIRVF